MIFVILRPVKEIVDGKIMLVRTYNKFKIRRIKKSNNNEIKLVTSKSIQENHVYKMLEIIGLVVKVCKEI